MVGLPDFSVISPENEMKTIDTMLRLRDICRQRVSTFAQLQLVQPIYSKFSVRFVFFLLLLLIALLKFYFDSVFIFIFVSISFHKYCHFSRIFFFQ